MWDNCATLHRATVDFRLPQRRLMQRTTLKGTEVR
jgi:alpha-ketoglutarate-dependent taurine dioxygenase